MDPSYQEFVRAYCQFSLSCDRTGKACFVVVKAAWPGIDGQIKQATKRIPLQPLTQAVEKYLRAWHEEEHRKNQAAGLAQGYGNAQHPPAYSQQFGYDPRYQTAGFGDFYKLAIRTAQKLASSKAAQELYEEMLDHRGALADALIPGGSQVLSIIEQAAHAVEKANEGDEEALDKIAAIKQAADQGDEMASQLVEGMRNLNDVLIHRKIKRIPRGRSRDHRVNGWLYNVPYRSSVRAALEPNPAMLSRYFYNRGLE